MSNLKELKEAASLLGCLLAVVNIDGQKYPVLRTWSQFEQMVKDGIDFKIIYGEEK